MALDSKIGIYDDDVIVIGNGPAAISAAIRARWVKGYSAMPSSVEIIGAGPMGGLLPWGGAILTGPGWAFKGEDLLEKLIVDLDRFRIPAVRGTVNNVRRAGPYWVVEGEGFTPRRALSVIIATGARVVGDEAAHFQRGVFMTFKGYEYIPMIIAEATRYSAGAGLLVVGNQRTEMLRELFLGVSDRAGGLVFLLDTAQKVRGEDRFPGSIVRGRLLEVARQTSAGASQDGDGRFRVTSIDHKGHTQAITCGAILLDYTAFEHMPAALVSSGPGDLENALLHVQRDERGFVMVDRWMRTSVPGLFAAGDVTGRYFSTLMALGDGVCAGFTAHRWAYRAKFGREPRLFAYMASDEIITPDCSDLPEIPLTSRPKLLGDEREFYCLAGQNGLGRLEESEASIFSGHLTVTDISGRIECPAAHLAELVRKACAARLMTVHVLSTPPGHGSAGNDIGDFNRDLEGTNGLAASRVN